MVSLYCEVMSDTVGNFYRLAGHADPWSKNLLVEEERQALVDAGAHPNDAATQAQNDVDTTLKTFVCPSNPCRVGADPSQIGCGIKNFFKQFTCLSSGLGKSILYVGIGALLLILIFNYLTRPR